MKRFLTGLMAIAALLVLSANVNVASAQNNDEAMLKQLVREWSDAAMQGDISALDRIQARTFQINLLDSTQDSTSKGRPRTMTLTNGTLKAALQSRDMSIERWTNDDVRVTFRGNTATVTGRSTLTNAKYKGMDFSGEWQWTDKFVKQKDGSWKAVASQARRIKK